MTSPTLTNLGVDSLLYGYVKEKNPCLLTQLFSKERCRELEKLDHLYDSKTLPSMLQKYRKIHTKPVEQNDRQEAELARMAKQGSIVQRQVKPIAMKGDLYSQDMMHRRFCRIADPQTSVDLTVYNYFHLNGDLKALSVLFDEETREKFGKMVTEIDAPAVLRLVAHRRKEKEKSKAENKAFLPISTCQLCKKNLKGTRAFLMSHIGVHEDVPMYCFVDGCDKFENSFNGICLHLLKKHLLYRNDLTASQYHLRQTMKTAYYKKAGRFLDKYFPPESFVGFADRKIQRQDEFEDERCASCGKIVKAARTRQGHVVNHLNLSSACVVEGCEVVMNPIGFPNHLKNHHAKRVRQLNVQELHKHRQNKAHFNKVMKEELPKYFPRKSGTEEE